MKTILRHPFLLIFPIVLVLPFPLMVDSIALFLACANLLVLSLILKQKPSWKSMASEPWVWIGLFVIIVDPLASFFRSDISFELRTSRLAMFMVPLVFYLFQSLIPRIRKPVLTSLVLGVLLYIFYSYAYLVYFYTFITNRDFSFNHYLKYDLSQYLPGSYHHTYLGMYMTFAIILLTFGNLLKTKRQILLLSLFILINQVFMGGKITLILSLLVLSAYIWKISINKKLVLTVFVAISVTTIYFLNLRGLFESINFSISNRLASWKCSLEAISQHPWFGLGKEKTYQFLSNCVGNDAISTHNQILNELVNYGILGLWILIFYWLIIKRSKGDLAFVLLATLIIIMSLFENILSLQRGILFVSFFATVLMISNENRKII